MSPSEINCAPALIWTDLYPISPETTVTVTSTATGSNIAGDTPSSLSYKVAKRYPTSVNTAGRRPHTYLSKSGGQICYPPVDYRLNAASESTRCGPDRNDTSTVYPDGTCSFYRTPAGVRGEATIAEKC